MVARFRDALNKVVHQLSSLNWNDDDVDSDATEFSDTDHQPFSSTPLLLAQIRLRDGPSSAASPASGAGAGSLGSDRSMRHLVKGASASYSRPDFVQLSASGDEGLRCSLDHRFRTVLSTESADSLPWAAGYAECVNGGKSVLNEDQAAMGVFSIDHASIVRNDLMTRPLVNNTQHANTSDSRSQVSSGANLSRSASQRQRFASRPATSLPGSLETSPSSSPRIGFKSRLLTNLRAPPTGVSTGNATVGARRAAAPANDVSSKRANLLATRFVQSFGPDSQPNAASTQTDGPSSRQTAAAAGPDLLRFAYFALFDGHAGSGASTLATKFLHLHLSQRLAEVRRLLMATAGAASSTGPPSTLSTVRPVSATLYDPFTDRALSLNRVRSESRLVCLQNPANLSCSNAAMTKSLCANSSRLRGSPASRPGSVDSLSAGVGGVGGGGGSGTGPAHVRLCVASEKMDRIELDSLVVGAIESAFLDMDAQIERQREQLELKGGSCALVVLFLLGRVYVANAGDSRAIAICGGRLLPLSKDFTPETERERLLRTAHLRPDLLQGEFNANEYLRRVRKEDMGRPVLCRSPDRVGWSYAGSRLVSDEADLAYPMVLGEGKKSRLLATIGVTRGFGDHDLTFPGSRIRIKPFLSAVPQVSILSMRSCQPVTDAMESAAVNDFDQRPNGLLPDGDLRSGRLAQPDITSVSSGSFGPSVVGETPSSAARCGKTLVAEFVIDSLTDADVIVMATDGLWDVLTSTQVGQICTDHFSKTAGAGHQQTTAVGRRNVYQALSPATQTVGGGRNSPSPMGSGHRQPPPSQRPPAATRSRASPLISSVATSASSARQSVTTVHSIGFPVSEANGRSFKGSLMDLERPNSSGELYQSLAKKLVNRARGERVTLASGLANDVEGAAGSSAPTAGWCTNLSDVGGPTSRTGSLDDISVFVIPLRAFFAANLSLAEPAVASSVGALGRMDGTGGLLASRSAFV